MSKLSLFKVFSNDSPLKPSLHVRFIHTGNLIANLGPVVRPVNANMVLKFHQGPCFSCLKEFSKQITSDRLKAPKVKM